MVILVKPTYTYAQCGFFGAMIIDYIHLKPMDGIWEEWDTKQRYTRHRSLDNDTLKAWVNY